MKAPRATVPRPGRRAVCLACLAVAGGVRAEALSKAGEYQVKAAFICKFASYVEWPADRGDGVFQIGVLGADDVVQEVSRAAAGLAVQGRPMVVRKVARGEPPANLHILFVARSHGGRGAEALAGVRGQPMLTVTESEDDASAGSVINFVVVDDKVRFDVALAPAERGNLKISARLLGVARKVTAKVS